MSSVSAVTDCMYLRRTCDVAKCPTLRPDSDSGGRLYQVVYPANRRLTGARIAIPLRLSPHGVNHPAFLYFSHMLRYSSSWLNEGLLQSRRTRRDYVSKVVSTFVSYFLLHWSKLLEQEQSTKGPSRCLRRISSFRKTIHLSYPWSNTSKGW